RHTIFSRDWSSDVCSSDLDVTEKVLAERELKELNAQLEARIAARTHDLEDALQRLQDESRVRQAAEESLRHAQKMEAVGQLTGEIGRASCRERGSITSTDQ